jgi:hypothetical protein
MQNESDISLKDAKLKVYTSLAWQLSVANVINSTPAQSEAETGWQSQPAIKIKKVKLSL